MFNPPYSLSSFDRTGAATVPRMSSRRTRFLFAAEAEFRTRPAARLVGAETRAFKHRKYGI
jgi:hypothetical protein